MFSSAPRMVIVFLWFLWAITVNLCMSHETNVTNVLCNRKDQHMLSMFKQSIKDPSNLLLSWTIEEDCCNWKGVQCNNITGRVTGLQLSWRHLVPLDNSDGVSLEFLRGEINFSLLQKLDFLSFLDLSFNNFKAIKFESVLGSPTNFTNLVYLDLSFNSILYMDNLRWLPRFSSLIYLDLSLINLSRETLWLQWMATLPSLTELKLKECNLTGNPSLGYVNITSLGILDISFNHFNSEIPKWLFNLSSRIAYLDLSSNNLRGQIPAPMLNFQNLMYLYLEYNSLSGSILEWIGQFKNLVQLDLSNNLLSGPIPTTIGNLSSLTYLDFANNHLNDSLPTALGKLSRLESLELGYNSLSGKLSEQSFTKLSSLKSLGLESSAFVFNFGTHWQPPFQLEAISLRYCKLGPEFPSWLYTQRSLYTLDISGSGLSFNVKDKFWSFVTQIENLFLSYNLLTGDISTTLFNGSTIELNSNNFTGRLPRLSPRAIIFKIGDNSFSGPIYPLLCQNKTGKQKLEVLDMSYNLLSGEIPNCWMHWQSLLHVNLEGNNISGEIPDSMGSLTNLESLLLRNNSLSGKIPSLENCNIWFLDLAFNEFTGKIPSWIGSLNMAALILRSNNFTGSVPPQICKFSNLLVLDLAHNKLSRPIPKCINNITTMVANTLDETLYLGHYYLWDASFGVKSYVEDLHLFVKGLSLDFWNSFELVRIVDLSNNELSGFIPQELFNLIALQSLNLSHNNLMGKIPSNVGQMKSLESLDFSGNLLSGEIPQSISNISFLSHLNLSYNNFDGRIPLSTQLQSFEASSYIGNPELCGPPLPKKCAQQERPNGSMKVSKDSEFKSSFKTGVGVGFASAFCGVFGILLFIGKWRHAYFRFLDTLYVVIAVKINHFRHKGP
ncbi:receptor-like protein EIX2 [Lotus japonicus]|uniref:receptor-like protein EIX2 n=1 Tax=Lotus japonicus TaxID=34305 RepID=UPI0025851C18|nr:receptor-like protein EIX2 [Lotus japonicus]